MNPYRGAIRFLVAAAILALPGALLAQSSAGYKLDEHTLNEGGRPEDTVVSTSTSFRLTLDSIGDVFARRSLAGTSHRMDGGFSRAYGPPGEVEGLDFLADRETLVWDWEPASTVFNVYADTLSSLPGTYGICAESRVTLNTWADTSIPAPGSTVFYLVTGENRLREEGTKGFTSLVGERANPSPCP